MGDGSIFISYSSLLTSKWRKLVCKFVCKQNNCDWSKPIMIFVIPLWLVSLWLYDFLLEISEDCFGVFCKEIICLTEERSYDINISPTPFSALVALQPVRKPWISDNSQNHREKALEIRLISQGWQRRGEKHFIQEQPQILWLLTTR